MSAPDLIFAMPAGWDHAVGGDRDHPAGTIAFVRCDGAIIVSSSSRRRKSDVPDSPGWHEGEPLFRQGYWTREGAPVGKVNAADTYKLMRTMNEAAYPGTLSGSPDRSLRRGFVHGWPGRPLHAWWRRHKLQIIVAVAIGVAMTTALLTLNTITPWGAAIALISFLAGWGVAGAFFFARYGSLVLRSHSEGD